MFRESGVSAGLPPGGLQGRGREPTLKRKKSAARRCKNFLQNEGETDTQRSEGCYKVNKRSDRFVGDMF